MQISFRDEVEKLKLNTDDKFFEDIEKYIQLLQKWNKIHNLTRMNLDEILSSIIDSIVPFQNINFSSLVDIGSGAGFPAIPIAILYREKKITLVEPIKKKSSFLYYIKTSLKLSNTTVISQRVENIDIEIPDLVTSRAVTDVKTLLDITTNIRREKTNLLFYKGSNLQNELRGLDLNYEIINRGNRNYLMIKA